MMLHVTAFGLYRIPLTDGQSPWWWWTGFHTPEQRSTSSAQQSRAFVVWVSSAAANHVVSTLHHCREHSSSTRPITLDVLWRVSRHHINHPVFSYAAISTRQLQTTADCSGSVRDWTLGVEQHIRSPIRNDPDHLLDLIIKDQPSNIRYVRVIDSRLVSDPGP